MAKIDFTEIEILHLKNLVKGAIRICEEKGKVLLANDYQEIYDKLDALSVNDFLIR